MRNLVWHCCTPEAHMAHMEHMCHLARHAHLSAIQVFRSIWQLWFSSICNSLTINLLYHLIRSEGMVTLSYSQNCTYSCGGSMRCRKLGFYAHSDIHSQLEGIGTENPAATQLLQWMLQILRMVDQISETLMVRGLVICSNMKRANGWKLGELTLSCYYSMYPLPWHCLSESVSGQYVNLWSHPPPCLVFLTLADHHSIALSQENYHFQGSEYQKINQEIQDIDLNGL